MQLIDIYICIDDYNRDVIQQFEEQYLYELSSQCDIYEYPQYNGVTEFETDNYKKMLSYILAEKGRYYKFFFKSELVNSVIKHGVIFLNKDTSLVLGVSVLPSFELEYISKLKSDFNSPNILVAYEITPPDNAIDFKKCL